MRFSWTAREHACPV